jgi:diketogulonate reductase-like aldo/keto reductase
LHATREIRTLGVSNHGVSELEDLKRTARVLPSVIQNKVDPYHVGRQLDLDVSVGGYVCEHSHFVHLMQGIDVLEYARANGMLLVGYSTFSAWPFVLSPLQDAIIVHIAKETGLTPSQVFAHTLTPALWSRPRDVCSGYPTVGCKQAHRNDPSLKRGSPSAS